MRVHGSRTHLGAFLPFRDARGGRFDFFARFSTRAEAPLSLDAADASAGMVSRSAALSPRKISTPSWIYPTLRYDPRGVRSDAETLTLRACDRRVTPTSARAPRSSTVPSKSVEVSTQDRERLSHGPQRLKSTTTRRLFLRLQETRREFSAGRPSSLAPPQRLAPGTSARARPASCARRRSSASDRQRGRVTRGSSDAASLLAIL